MPKPSVAAAPSTTSRTPTLARRSSPRTELGRSARIAPSWSVPATAAPANMENAPSRWKRSSQWYAVTGSLRYGDARDRAPPAPADRDDCRRQLDARSRGGPPPRRDEGRRRARRRRLLRLPVRRAQRRARAARYARRERRGDDAPAA